MIMYISENEMLVCIVKSYVLNFQQWKVVEEKLWCHSCSQKLMKIKG